MPEMFDYDAIIVGSGFGGATAALRLARAGMRLAILEKGAFRGRMAGAEPFPDSPLGFARSLHGLDLDVPLLRNRRVHRRGLYELHRLSGVSFLGGVGVGGSSLVYGAVTQPPAEGFFDAFPAELSSGQMQEHLDFAAGLLDARLGPAPASRSGRLRVAAEAVERGAFELLPQAIAFAAPGVGPRPDGSAESDAATPCTLCNRCATGCTRGAKKSLDLGVIRSATAAGAGVLDLHEVDRLHRVPGGYRVVCVDLRGREPRVVSLTTPRVVLAAGVLHTHKILFRSREGSEGLARLSPRLGHGFSIGGDSLGVYHGTSARMGYGRGHSVEAGVAVGDAQGRRDHVVFQVEIPFVDAVFARPLRGLLDRTLLLAAMGRDDANGVLSFRDGRLRLAMPDQPVLGRIRGTMDAIARSHGVPERAMQQQQRGVERPRASVHPLGGCRMADAPSRGVVDFRGEVFGHRGLFVADASLLNAPPVAAPSLAITALASHVATMILDERAARGERADIGAHS